MTTAYDQLKALHTSEEPLILYNCWDVATARCVNDSVLPVIATTSYGMAAALGFSDGEKLPFEWVVQMVKQIIQQTTKPVTVDIEGGYGSAYLAHIDALLTIGVAGINIEDQVIGAVPPALAAIDAQADKIKEIRSLCQRTQRPLFINARTDVFFQGAVQSRALCLDALKRAEAYHQAGADGIFVPGLTDPGLIAYFTAHSPLPVNIMVTEGPIDRQWMAAQGVKRISCGPGAFFKTNTFFGQQLRTYLGEETT
jgi:2-methylisocitrate lyase-like PEP mutase family enzyme